MQTEFLRSRVKILKDGKPYQVQPLNGGGKQYKFAGVVRVDGGHGTIRNRNGTLLYEANSITPISEDENGGVTSAQWQGEDGMEWLITVPKQCGCKSPG